ncbi:MAG: hypothetical protein JJT81_03755 [Rubellimicrobium sp.]|nr:hypothetical protein [Rubellimicrobium sp.]
MTAHTPVGVVGATFLLLSQEKSNFHAMFLRRLPILAPLVVLRIGAVLNFLAETGVIEPRGRGSAVTGPYPHCQPLEGDWEASVLSVREQLQALVIPIAMDAPMKCVVGMQADLVRLGLDKVIGASSQPLRAGHAPPETGTRYAGLGQRVPDRNKKLLELRTTLRTYNGDPVDLFLSIM